jgi:hypothetical protein
LGLDWVLGRTRVFGAGLGFALDLALALGWDLDLAAMRVGIGMLIAPAY